MHANLVRPRNGFLSPELLDASSCGSATAFDRFVDIPFFSAELLSNIFKGVITDESVPRKPDALDSDGVPRISGERGCLEQ